MNRILFVALILSSASMGIAQTAGTGPPRPPECKLTLSQAPVIRGIRLGTTVEQTLAVFPGAADDQALRGRLSGLRFGFQSVMLGPGKYGSKEKFEGVKSIFVGFLDEQLIFFSLTYDGPEWTSDEQFTAKVAEALNLPGLESWRTVQGGMGLACTGFSVTAQHGYAEHGPSILIKNLQIDADRIRRERAEEPKEKARRAFKP
jgi:hypothetical protein